MSTTYTVYFSENVDFSNAITVVTNVNKEIKNAMLVPGKTYYWKVIATIHDGALAGGKIKVNDALGRFIYIDGIKNVRDMGGWSTTSGKNVKYGMLYRGAQLNTEKNGEVVNAVSEEGLEVFNKLGIKTEFYLRNMQNVHVQTNGTNLNCVLLSSDDISYSAYHNIFQKAKK